MCHGGLYLSLHNYMHIYTDDFLLFAGEEGK
jgi:hypothetical protein